MTIIDISATHKHPEKEKYSSNIKPRMDKFFSSNYNQENKVQSFNFQQHARQGTIHPD
jgi:hypothetical protein